MQLQIKVKGTDPQVRADFGLFYTLYNNQSVKFSNVIRLKENVALDRVSWFMKSI